MNTPKKKHRITVTYTFEYDANPEHYPSDKTDQDRLKTDIENFQDPFHVAEFVDGEMCIKNTVTGEVVEV